MRFSRTVICEHEPLPFPVGGNEGDAVANGLLRVCGS